MRPLDEFLLFFPAKYPSGDWSVSGSTFEDVWFTSQDGTRIHGWYFPRRNARAVLLFCHGNAGNLSHRRHPMARLQSELRVAVLIFDYRGYGRSEGVPTIEGALDDARAARAFLANRSLTDESSIVLMGRSLGGALVVKLAAELAPRGLILESTFSSLRDVASVHCGALAWLVPSEKLDVVAFISTYRGPLLQSHGDADRTIPFELGRKVFDAANEPKEFITIFDGDHNDPQSDAYYERLDQFIEVLSRE